MGIRASMNEVGTQFNHKKEVKKTEMEVHNLAQLVTNFIDKDFYKKRI